MKTFCLCALLMAGVAARCQSAPGQHDAGMEHHEHKPSTPATTLTVKAGAKTMVFTLADLQAMPQRSITVHN